MNYWFIDDHIVKELFLIFQEAEQKRLEEEMRKRRERIELWRAERKKAETAEGVKQIVKNATAVGGCYRIYDFCDMLLLYAFFLLPYSIIPLLKFS